MDFETFDYRDGLSQLDGGREWEQLRTSISRISRDAVVGRQQEVSRSRGSVPVGGQTAMNSLFVSHLEPAGWRRNRRVFQGDHLPSWKIDFFKAPVAVEVSFEHVKYLPGVFMSLAIVAGPARPFVSTSGDVGVVLLATEALKAWSRMDSAVGTFEQAVAWMDALAPLLPSPLVLVGLHPRTDSSTWEATDAFPGRA